MKPKLPILIQLISKSETGKICPALNYCTPDILTEIDHGLDIGGSYEETKQVFFLLRITFDYVKLPPKSVFTTD